MKMSVRIIISLVVVAALLVVGGAWAVSTVISTDTARQAIEKRISDIVGLPVRLAGRTEVRFFPRPYAIFNNLTVVDQSGSLLIDIDRVMGDFALMSIIRSDPTFRSFRFERPTIFVRQDENGMVVWPALNMSDEQAETSGQSAIASDPLTRTQAIIASLPAALGRATIANGTINFISESDEEDRFITQLDGTLAWPRRDGAISLTTTFTWRGRGGQLKLEANSVGDLFSTVGDTLAVDLSIGAASLRFDGEASLEQPRFSRGNIALSFQSGLAVRRWIDQAPTLLAGIENLSIAGSASFTEQRARMDDANITINEHNGIGALELMTRETGERILTATAAFDAVDLGKLAGPSWRELNRPFDPAGGVRKSMTGLNADIRISASMANVGALQLDNFAGAVSVRDEAISIDIGDASLAGGTLQLRYKDDATLSKDPVSLSVKGTDIDTSALPSEVSLGPLIPRGPISFTADLNGPSRVIRRALRSATGTISVSGQQGRLPGISVSDVLDTNDATQFFALAAEGGDGDIFDTFEADLTLADGAYRPEQIKVTYPSATLNVNGVISATNGSVAMTAILQEVEDGMIPPPPVFIGGTLLQPFATFILAPPDRIQ